MKKGGGQRAEGGRNCRITVLDEHGGVLIDQPRIQAVVDAALAEDGMGGCALTVLVVGDAESARLHGSRRWWPRARRQRCW